MKNLRILRNDWTFVKEFDPDKFLSQPDTGYHSSQLHLSLDAKDGPFEPWYESDGPGPQRILTDFLESIGATHPDRMAGSLLRDFGSISGILSASWWGLRRSVGHRLASAIRASRDLVRCALLEKVAQGPVVSNRREVLDFLQAQVGYLKREKLLALYVDVNLRLLRVEQISQGLVSETPLDIAKIIHFALEVGAPGFILVHNHPSGDPTPSRSDHRATALVSRVAADLNMTLIDHLVVAGNEVRSMIRPWGRGCTEQHPPPLIRQAET